MLKRSWRNGALEQMLPDSQMPDVSSQPSSMWHRKPRNYWIYLHRSPSDNFIILLRTFRKEKEEWFTVLLYFPGQFVKCVCDNWKLLLYTLIIVNSSQRVDRWKWGGVSESAHLYFSFFPPTLFFSNISQIPFLSRDTWTRWPWTILIGTIQPFETLQVYQGYEQRCK